MSKIKVLHVTQATIGGTLEYIKLFFKNIDQEKYEIYLACPSYGPMKEEIEKLGVKVYAIDMAREISLKKDLNSYRKINKLIKKVRPDIVHLHSSKAGVLGKIASYFNRIPCIYNPHGWAFSMNISDKKKVVYALIEKYTSLFCNSIVNISEYEYKLAKQYKIASDKKMLTIYNGIDIDRFSEEKFCRQDTIKELNIPNNAFIVGMIARISEQKNPIKFVEVAKGVCEKIDNAYFILVGDGEQRNEVENLIEQYNLKDKVKITGWVSDIDKYLSIFDVAILTSKWEGFGLVIAEYMAACKPIVASNVGGIPELIKHNYNGVLVDDDVDIFVNSILEISKDEKLKQRYINNSKDILREKFSIDTLIKKHDELYTKLVQNNSYNRKSK